MINPKNIKKSQARHILRLIEQAARADVLARLGRFDNLEFADWFLVKLKKQDELLEYIFGTSSLVELAHRWKMLKRTGKIKKKKERK